MQVGVHILTFPVTLFEDVPDLTKGTVDPKKLKPKNPRPMKCEADLQKLNQRIKVSKDLLKAMLKYATSQGSERAIKEQLDKGVSATQIEDDANFQYLETQFIENELRKAEMLLENDGIVFSFRLRILDRFNKRRISCGKVLGTFRVQIVDFTEDSN